MSARTFARLYTAETGVTPAKAVESMRVEAACRMLIQTKSKLSAVARKCGFIGDERMRRAFLRQVKSHQEIIVHDSQLPVFQQTSKALILTYGP